MYPQKSTQYDQVLYLDNHRNTHYISHSPKDERAAAFLALKSGIIPRKLRSTHEAKRASYPRQYPTTRRASHIYIFENANDDETKEENDKLNCRIAAWLNEVSQSAIPEDFESACGSPTSEMMINHAVRLSLDDLKEKQASQKPFSPPRYYPKPHYTRRYGNHCKTQRTRSESTEATYVEPTSIHKTPSFSHYHQTPKHIIVQTSRSKFQPLTELFTCPAKGMKLRSKPSNTHNVTSLKHCVPVHEAPLRDDDCEPPAYALRGNVLHHHHHHYHNRSPLKITNPLVIKQGSCRVTRDRDGRLQLERKIRPQRSSSGRQLIPQAIPEMLQLVK